MQVALAIATLSLDPRDGAAVLLLEHQASGRVFPLWLGDREAAAIAWAADKRTGALIESASLMHNLVQALGGQVRQVSITGVVAGVVRSEVTVVQADEEIVLAARTSDAIVLAVQAGAPMLIEEALLDQVANRVLEAEERVRPEQTYVAAEAVHRSAAERWNALIGHLSQNKDRSTVYEA